MARPQRLVAAVTTVLAVAMLLLTTLAWLPPHRVAAETRLLVPGSDAKHQPPGPGESVATFGAGCFWCVQKDFDDVPGVLRTTTGYMGGMTLNPTYDDVSGGRTGHAEVVQVVYDPAKVSYEQLLTHYWRHTDVLDGRGQFCDRGSAYRPVIFTHDEEQHRLAREGKEALDKSGRFLRPIAVQVVRASTFTPAEPEHQKYYERNPRRYALYRWGCGRDTRLQQLWGRRAR